MASYAGVVQGVATAVNLLCDVCMLGESAEAWAQASDRGEDSQLETASVVNSLVLAVFSVAEIGSLVSGKRSETLHKIKSIEAVPRALNIPVQLLSQFKQMIKEANTTGFIEPRSIIRLIEKGIAAPCADMYRTAASAGAYYEQHFLDMTPEELEKAKRPIYETVFDSDGPSSKIVGYKPVDPEECKANLAKFRIHFENATIVRATAQKGAVEVVVCDLGIPAIQRLAAFFGMFPPPVGRPGGAGGPEGGRPGGGAGDHPEGGAGPHDVARDLDLDLLHYPNIPEPLHGDQVFRQYVCPITQQPIRDPVRDPTNGMTLYERRAIEVWLQHNPVSPITRRPLQIADLQPAPTVRNQINSRLRQYQDELRHFLEERASEPVAEPRT